MTQQPIPRGWQFHHHEQLFFRANMGAPMIRLKFYHYPPYRQIIFINQPPAYCKLKTKRDNAFFFFQKKVRMKETISLERIISVYPKSSNAPEHRTWGRISDIPRLLQRKYKQSFPYWPMSSSVIQDVSEERWFAVDDLYEWTQTMSRYLIMKIKHPEKQEKRLGADQAILTGSGDCDEFTDLFITFARIRGIPCRRLTGYFINQINTKPEPHAWTEILSPISGWIPIDVALHNLGNYTPNYVISKIEEFNPSLPDYQILNQTSAVHYHWERPLPIITPIYESLVSQ